MNDITDEWFFTSGKATYENDIFARFSCILKFNVFHFSFIMIDREFLYETLFCIKTESELPKTSESSITFIVQFFHMS